MDEYLIKSACECGRVDPQQRHDVFAFDAFTNYADRVLVRFVRKICDIDQNRFQVLEQRRDLDVAGCTVLTTQHHVLQHELLCAFTLVSDFICRAGIVQTHVFKSNEERFRLFEVKRWSSFARRQNASFRVLMGISRELLTWFRLTYGGCFFGGDGDGERRGAVSSLPLLGEGDASGSGCFCCAEAVGTGVGVWTAKWFSLVRVLVLIHECADDRCYDQKGCEGDGGGAKPQANPRAGACRGVARIFFSAALNCRF